MNKKKMSIPGWFSNYSYLIDFLDYYYSNPQFFYQDREIDSTYDFYYCNLPLLWCGGRIPPSAADPNINMEKILEKFNDFPSIKLRHVFTNCLLDHDYLINDFRCNQFVHKYIRPQDEIIVNHPKLIKHLKLCYPNIPLIYSTTLNIMDIDTINEITKNNIYVLNYNKNNDNNYINQLQHKENIEILCGELCVDNCPNRAQHYLLTSQKILDAQLDSSQLKEIDCPMIMNEPPTHLKDILNYKHSITNERIEELSNMGIQYFKIAGRSIPLVLWLDILLYYLALPEYHDELKQMFLLNWW